VVAVVVAVVQEETLVIDQVDQEVMEVMVILVILSQLLFQFLLLLVVLETKGTQILITQTEIQEAVEEIQL
jgi:hypothetical protein